MSSLNELIHEAVAERDLSEIHSLIKNNEFILLSTAQDDQEGHEGAFIADIDGMEALMVFSSNEVAKQFVDESSDDEDDSSFLSLFGGRESAGGSRIDSRSTRSAFDFFALRPESSSLSSQVSHRARSASLSSIIGDTEPRLFELRKVKESVGSSPIMYPQSSPFLMQGLVIVSEQFDI